MSQFSDNYSLPLPKLPISFFPGVPCTVLCGSLRQAASRLRKKNRYSLSGKGVGKQIAGSLTYISHPKRTYAKILLMRSKVARFECDIPI
jgi:hypothetical protein